MNITDEMNKALDLVQNTNQHVFITGKAGTGKTTFLKYLIKNCNKNCIVAAPTGIAAIHAGGVTLHSLFGIPFKPISPTEHLDNKFTKYKASMLLQLNVLIIDEISMVRPDVIDTIDRKLRWVRKSEEPFGGVQIVMFGDLFQLPPVVKKEEKEILENYYDGCYFFDALVWRETGFNVIELTQIFRQTDENFIRLLNNIRVYKVSNDEIDLLGEHKNKEVSTTFNDERIHICTHKREVDKINNTLLGEYQWTNEAKLNGKFNESAVPCDMELRLRVGARVMALCNNPKDGYYNGMLGEVIKLTKSHVTVRMDNNTVVKFEPHKWSCNQFVLKDNQIISQEIGSCTQFPLALAWAITIHKSQGLTFDNIVLHVTRTFCPGQLYVALSRCRTLDGITLDSYITKRMVIPEYALIDFMRTYKADNDWFGKRIKNGNEKNQSDE